MQMHNMHDAKSHLSELVALACSGEDIVICKAGKPMVKLVRYQPIQGKRQPGGWRGKVKVAKNFDDSCPEIELLFGGE